MINDPFHPEEAAIRESESNKRKFVAVICAVAITAIIFAGYAYFRKYHAQRVQQNAAPSAPEVTPRGPALVHVVVDEPTLEKGMSTVGGVVKNISNEPLSNLSVTLELRRRKDGSSEQTTLEVKPGRLEPQQEGSYGARFSIREYASGRLANVQADPQAQVIVYTSSQGKKRPPERLQPQVVIGKRTTQPGEFLNTPDNPGRIP